MLAMVSVLHLTPVLSLGVFAPLPWAATGACLLCVSMAASYRRLSVDPGLHLSLSNGLAVAAGDRVWPVVDATVASQAIWLGWRDDNQRQQSLMLLSDSFFCAEDWRMARVAARHAAPGADGAAGDA